MVDLVLEDARQPAFSLDGHAPVGEVKSLHADGCGALHVAEEVRQTQASFLGDRGLLGAPGDLGVGEHITRIVVLHHDQPLRDADLRRGQADARRRPHRLEHVLRQLACGRGDTTDRPGASAQHGRCSGVDLQEGHRQPPGDCRLQTAGE